MNWAGFQAKFSTSIESFWFRESEREWWPGNGYDFIKPKLRSKLASAPNHAAASSEQCRKVSSWFRCSRLGLHSRAASTKDCGRIVVLTTRKGVTKPDWNDRPNWEVSAPSGIGLGLKFKFCLCYSWWATIACLLVSLFIWLPEDLTNGSNPIGHCLLSLKITLKDP